MFKDALIKSAKKLSQLKEDRAITDFALIGGMALAAYLEPRATADIDFVVKLGAVPLENVAKLLKGKAQKGDIYDPLAGSISFAIKTSGGKVPIQLIQLHAGLEDIAVQNIEQLRFQGKSIPIVNRQGLILLKLYSGGPIDIEDARKLVESKKLSKKESDYITAKAKMLRITSRLSKIKNL